MTITRPGMHALARMSLAAVAAIALASCGGQGGSSPGPEPAPVTDPDPPDPDGCEDSFDTTFEAIQTVVFERHGCTTDVCHGSAASGGP